MMIVDYRNEECDGKNRFMKKKDPEEFVNMNEDEDEDAWFM